MDASTPLPQLSIDSWRPRRGRRRGLSGLLALGGLLAAYEAVCAPVAEPFRTRNLNPFVAMMPWPAWQVPDETARTRLIMLVEAANHYTFSVAGAEGIALDGETWRTSIFAQHHLADHWSLGVEVAYLHHSGGVFDDLVDGFHSALRLPDGGRNFRPEDTLSYALFGPAGQAYSLESSGGGLGDIQLSLARQLGEGPRPLLVQGTLTLPTGSADQLFGSETAGGALSVLQSRPFTWRDRAVGWYWAAGVLLPGQPDVEGFVFRDVAYLGTVGAAWQVWPRIGFKLQLDAHSAFYEADLMELGSTGLQMTLGGWWRGQGNRAIEVAVNEDLRVSTSPDVVVQVALRWGWE